MKLENINQLKEGMNVYVVYVSYWKDGSPTDTITVRESVIEEINKKTMEITCNGRTESIVNKKNKMIIDTVGHIFTTKQARDKFIVDFYSIESKITCTCPCCGERMKFDSISDIFQSVTYFCNKCDTYHKTFYS